jgi:hypothetical protein
MAEEGRARIVQYDLPEPSLDAWLEHTAPENAWFCVLNVSRSNSAPALPSGEEGEFSAKGVYSYGARPERKTKPDEASRQSCQKLCAAVWINGFTGKAALFHVVVFRGFTHLAREICRLSCRWAFSGGLACLLGLIPRVNRAALAAMGDCGWQEVLRIPKACFVHRKGCHVDGVLCRFTPNLLS